MYCTKWNVFIGRGVAQGAINKRKEKIILGVLDIFMGEGEDREEGFVSCRLSLSFYGR